MNVYQTGFYAKISVSVHQRSQEEIVKEKSIKKDEKKKPQKTLKEKRKAKREKENK